MLKAHAVPAADLLALGSLYFEPLWIFSRTSARTDDMLGLRGKRLAVGPEGSGTRALVDLLLTANGIRPESLTLRPLTGLDAVRALRRGEVDAAVVVASPESLALREGGERPRGQPHELPARGGLLAALPLPLPGWSFPKARSASSETSPRGMSSSSVRGNSLPRTSPTSP